MRRICQRVDFADEHMLKCARTARGAPTGSHSRVYTATTERTRQRQGRRRRPDRRTEITNRPLRRRRRVGSACRTARAHHVDSDRRNNDDGARREEAKVGNARKTQEPLARVRGRTELICLRRRDPHVITADGSAESRENGRVVTWRDKRRLTAEWKCERDKRCREQHANNHKRHRSPHAEIVSLARAATLRCYDFCYATARSAYVS